MPAYWRGYLKLSLVTCPIELTPATTEADKVRFRTINKATGNPIVSRYVDAVTGKAVDESDEVRGYERGENDFLILEDEELENVALDSARTIDVEKFIAHDTVEWIWFESPYYVSPSDPVGHEAFAVIRDAMRASGVIGLSRVVLGRRERACILEPRDKGLLLWTLKFGEEVRPEAEYFAGIPDGKADPELRPLIAQLIKAQKKPWDTAMVTDPVQERLLALIEEKKKAMRPKKASKKIQVAEPVFGGKVVSIMDALRQSIEQSKTRRAG
jgi:DNA end-binding protein Ku